MSALLPSQPANKRVLIVIPTYNEVENIRPLVSSITAAFRHQTNYEPDLLFVDDNSPDGTAKIVSTIRITNKNVHLLRGPKGGLGKAYIRGLTYGLKLKPYFAIIMMDADLSHSPSDILKLLAGIESGADFVIGSRYITHGRNAEGYSALRHFQSRAANLIAKLSIDLGVNILDLTSGFKAIRRSSLETIPLKSIVASGYVFQVSLLYEFAKQGYAIKEAPITFRSRRQGSSKLGWHDILEFLWHTHNLNPNSKLRRIIRFSTVGAIGVVVNLVVLISLVRVARVNVVLSYIIAIETSIITNFFLNQRFTFNALRAANQELSRVASTIFKLIRYNVISLGGAGIAWVVFSVAFHRLDIEYWVADIIGIVAATGWNYWLSVKLVWRLVDEPLDAEPVLTTEPEEA